MSTSKVASHFDELSDGWSSRYRKTSFKQRQISFSRLFSSYITPSSRVLDLGCGAGDMTSILLKLTPNVTAADIAPKMIHTVRSRFANIQNLTIDHLLSPSLPYSDRSFDLVVSSSVIEYVDSPELFLAEIYRVLAPGGVLLVSFPPPNSPIRLFQMFVRKLVRDNFRMFDYLTLSRNTFKLSHFRALSAQLGYEYSAYIKIPFSPLLSRFPLSPSLFLVVLSKP